MTTQFQKGNKIGVGRPKGAVSKHRRNFAKLIELASEDVDFVYKGLRAKIEAGEAWAYQLYIKDLIPKRDLQPLAEIDLDSEDRNKELIDSLNQFDLLTHEEVLAEIKTRDSFSKEEEEIKDNKLEISVTIAKNQNVEKLAKFKEMIAQDVKEKELQNKENK